MKFDAFQSHSITDPASAEAFAYRPLEPVAVGPDATGKPRRKSAGARVSGNGTGKGLLSPDIVRSGYVPRYPVFDAVLNRSFAALMLIATAPIFLLVSLAVLGASGRPLFFSGVRLGKGMREFKMLKFRTLHPDAAAQTKDRTLPRQTLLETNIGSYLRKSRLDELPQLINILMGDMVFFGPRPTRPELLAVYEREAPGYRIRFNVHPGLVGMSQALLPHSAGKRLRGRFNAMCCRAPIRYPATFGFVFAVGWAVLRRSVSTVREAIGDARSPLTQFNFLRSGFARPRDATLQIETDGGAVTAGLVGVSDRILQFATVLPPETGGCEVAITRKLASGRQVRIKLKADIKAAYPVGPGQSGFICYASYHPTSIYNSYRIERFLLDQTVLPT